MILLNYQVFLYAVVLACVAGSERTEIAGLRSNP